MLSSRDSVLMSWNNKHFLRSLCCILLSFKFWLSTVIELCLRMNTSKQNSQWLLEVPHFYLKLTKNTQLKNIFAKKKHLFALQSIKKSNAVLKELGNFSTNSYFHYIPPSSTEKSLVTIRPELICGSTWRSILVLVRIQQVLHESIRVGYLILARTSEHKKLASLLFLSSFQMIQTSPCL